MAFNYTNKIKIILMKTGWSQQTLARKIGCSEKQMCFWMQNRAKPNKESFLRKIDEIYLEKVHGQETIFSAIEGGD